MSDSQTIRISIEQTGSQVETVRSSIEQVSLTQVAHSQTSQFPLQVEETSRGSIQPGKPMSEFEVESPIFTNRSLDFNFRLPSLAVPEIPAPRIQMPKISLPRFNFKKPEFMKRDNFLLIFRNKIGLTDEQNRMRDFMILETCGWAIVGTIILMLIGLHFVIIVGIPHWDTTPCVGCPEAAASRSSLAARLSSTEVIAITSHQSLTFSESGLVTTPYAPTIPTWVSPTTTLTAPASTTTTFAGGELVIPSSVKVVPTTFLTVTLASTTTIQITKEVTEEAVVKTVTVTVGV